MSVVNQFNRSPHDKYRKVLVTGASGFIGRYVVSELLLDNAEVYVLSRNAKQLIENFTNIHIIQSDITQTINIPENISTIYHCAGNIRSIDSMYSVNVNGTNQVIKAAIKSGCKLVHLSSAGVVRPSSANIIDEISDCIPASNYERTKLEAERIILEAVKEGLQTVILRPTIVFGVGRNPKNDSFLHLIRAIKSGKYRNIENGKGIYNIVHAQEVARAMLILEQSEKRSGETYFINTPVSFKELSKYVSDAILCSPPKSISFSVAFLAAAFCSMLNKLSISELPLTWSRLSALTNKTIYSQDRLLAETNYVPKASVEQYIQEVCNSYISLGLL
ncbi:MAG: NAD(P)-dependent oxidoreductase [Dissulfurispiraceae bacterium]|jgi:nucleoside-diphosphate-sugar epimerase|nr:NAD(P)-dependent oxidoreductase [Dissulfurispiraceae bacterium]